MPPNVPVFNEDGSYSSLLPASTFQFGVFDNPVAISNQLKGGGTAYRILSNVYAEWNILDEMSFRTTFGVDYYDDEKNDYWPSTLARNGNIPPVSPEANQYANKSFVWLNENTLNYNKAIGKRHIVNALAGFTAQRGATKQAFVRTINHLNDLVPTVDAGEVVANTNTKSRWALLSYLARLHYQYDSRYLLTATLRRDGSSRFGPRNRWAMFPSVAVGWNLAEEKFMRSSYFLNQLKLRASYGIAGNHGIGNYNYLGLITRDEYVFGGGTGTTVIGYRPVTMDNPELSWERMKQIDLGIDVAVFKNRLQVVVDYFQKETSRLLLEVPVPGSTGSTTAFQNIGSVLNTGWEFSMNSINLTKAFKWNTQFNVSFYKNRVLALGRQGDPIITTSRGFSPQTHITSIGHPIGSFYGYKAIGIYKDQADVDNSPKITGTGDSRPGDLKFMDIDEDGLITPADRQILGDNLPNMIYGINNEFAYGNFSLNILMDGVSGVQVLNGSRRNIELTTHSYSRRDVQGRWRSEDEPGDNRTPRANTNPTGGNVAFVSSLFIEDASFFRVRNINLRYNVPARVFNYLRVKEASIFFAVQNALIISDYQNFNPEQNLNGADVLTPGVDFNGYPIARTFAAGLSITFQ